MSRFKRKFKLPSFQVTTVSSSGETVTKRVKRPDSDNYFVIPSTTPEDDGKIV